MRLAAFIIPAVAALLASMPAQAQTYDPHWPVCMKVFAGGVDGAGEWVDCSYTSMAQCQAAASGRGAMCVINPYGSLAQGPDRIVRPPRRKAGQ